MKIAANSCMYNFDTAKLIKLYSEQPRTVDDLPYTDEMEQLANDFNYGQLQTLPTFSCRELLLILQRLRKANKLVRKPRKKNGR